MKSILLFFAAVVLLAGPSCTSTTGEADNFVHVTDMKFTRNGKPYTFMGTNFWYGINLGQMVRRQQGQADARARPTEQDGGKKPKGDGRQRRT